MADLSSGDLDTGENPARPSQAIGVIERFGEPNSFLAMDDPFREPSLLRENPESNE